MSTASGKSSYDASNFEITPNLEDRLKALSPAEQEAVKLFWRSVVMRSQRAFSEENGRLPQCTTTAAAVAATVAGVRSCNCCPYGYHIDLDFVRYCEALANAKPSEEELRRRSRRRSRKSMEFMLGFESLFDQWEAAERVQAVPEVSQESEPDSPRPLFSASTPYSLQQPPPPEQRPRSSSVPRYAYGNLTRSESPFGTASSTCSSLRGGGGGGNEGEAPPPPFPMRRPANSPPETRAFLRDALDEVCSDFERTLERTSMKRKKGGAAEGGVVVSLFGARSDRNNNSTAHNGGEKRNYYSWDRQYDTLDSCVTGNKSPRSSRSFSKSYTLPFRQQPSPAEQQYESYVLATVAANAKSPVEELLTPPPPPPRRHAHHTKLFSPPSSSSSGGVPVATDVTKDVVGTTVALLSPATDAATAATDAQTLFNIRQQMALSLKRMKDLEEQVRSIPEMQHELTALRDEKQRLQQTLQLKNEELQKARDATRFSSSPSPVASPKFASPVQQFTPQRISPIALESLGARLRTNSTSSESHLKTSLVLKRDVATMCGLHATRDIAVGSPKVSLRTIGTSPAQAFSLTELLYTQLQVEQRIQAELSAQEAEHLLKEKQQQKRLISVGTQMYVPKRDVRDNGAQTAPEKPLLKYAVGVMAKPATRESFVSCKPDVRTVGVSEDRVTDVLCEKCSVDKRTIGCGTEEMLTKTINGTQTASLSLKLLDMPGRSNTFSLGDNEKLQLKRKTIGTQYTPVVVHSAGSQTSSAIVHTVSVQYSPETRVASTQSNIDSTSRQTDTRGLIRLCATQTSTDEIATPKPTLAPILAHIAPLKPPTRSTSSNTDAPKTSDYGVNTAPPARTRHSGSNTETVHKRDIACGDIVKPHISIACADNYCDSCKDAIKHLAKDFSKVLASPVPTRAADSKIPRPKHLSSPSPVRKPFQRQNTYTITPSPTPSPVTEKKSLMSSLQEKPPSIASFHQFESSGEAQSFITEPTSSQKSAVIARRPSNSSQRGAEELEAVFAQSETPPNSFEPMYVGTDDLIVREETRVRISWSRDASPAPLRDGLSPLKSLDNSFNEEQLAEAVEPASPDVSKGARKKTPSPLKSSQTDVVQEPPPTTKKVHDELESQRPPSKGLLQKLAMVEAEPRQKIIPPKEMLSALKLVNDSLLKKMGAKAFSSASLKLYKTVITQEWFRISSTDKANPHEVEDYVDCFEELSVPLLEYCVNMVDSNGNTAMHYAVSHGNFDVVSILLDSKVCNVNQMNNAGYTSVMLVSLAKLRNAAHRTVVERLFQMADVNIRAKKHCQTALMLAVSHGNLDMVEMLLAAGADINIQDEDGSTALMCAAEHGRVDIVKHLLTQSDCNSLVQDMDGSTAFKIAWQAGHRDIGLLLYVHEQMLRSKMPNRGAEQRTPTLSPRQHKRQPSK